jgi:hypothetical protein
VSEKKLHAGQDEMLKALLSSRQDAVAITNATAQFMMSRAEMINCSPLLCFMIMEAMCKKNVKLHVDHTIDVVRQKMSKSGATPRMREEMQEVIDMVNKTLLDDLEMKEVSMP